MKLGFVLLRVNAAVVENFVFTVRLPDRLCVGVGIGGRTGRRLPADQDACQAPDLTVFERYLPPRKAPKADDIAAAVAIYLSATCGAAAEHARERLSEIEYKVLQLPAVTEGERDVERLLPLCQEVFRTRGALQAAEEELMRVVQRQAEVNVASRDHIAATRTRYEQGLEEMRCVKRDLRAIGDAIHARIASSQVHVMQEAENRNKERQARLQSLIGILGTALVVPALVATLFSDAVRLPHPKPIGGLIMMLAVMFASAGVVWWLINFINRRSDRAAATAALSLPGRRRGASPGARAARRLATVRS
jgi:Mg2+ and Co2+ transporter CorA